MRLTRVHLAFWDAHRRPGWATRVEHPTRRPSIHECINAHVEPPKGGLRDLHHAGNMIVFLKGTRKRGEDMYLDLVRMAYRPETLIRPERRAGFARKWGKRVWEKRVLDRYGPHALSPHVTSRVAQADSLRSSVVSLRSTT